MTIDQTQPKGQLMSTQRPRSGPAPTATARHGRLKRSNPVLGILKFLGISLVVVAVSAGSIVAIETYRTVSSIHIIDLPNDTQGPPPDIAAMTGGFNILIVGSDTGIGQGSLGEDRGSATLNDVTMLMHVSQDHSNAVVVSIPRDLVVPIPSCPKKDGSGNYARMSAQPINVTLSYGGLACTILTVQALTGLTVNFAGLITFTGVIEMSNAVGGVPVCIAEPIHDRYTGFTRDAGVWELSGYDALMFLRSRHGVGDGSDLTRISSQQVFLSSLVRTLKSQDTLSNPAKLYAIGNAALSNMELTRNLANLDVMVSIAKALNDLPLENVTFVQYPGTTGGTGIYLNKVAPTKSTADLLFAKIKADEPFAVSKAGDGLGSVLDPNATPLPVDSSATADPSAPPAPAVEVIPGLKGQTAADQTCSAANKG
jgi:LCP family protein required for cell wall assembly